MLNECIAEQIYNPSSVGTCTGVFKFGQPKPYRPDCTPYDVQWRKMALMPYLRSKGPTEHVHLCSLIIVYCMTNVEDHKNLSLVWGVDRKIHPEDPCLASQNSFSCTPFISEWRFFNNAVTLIADICHTVMTLLVFNDVIMFSDVPVNLNDGVLPLQPVHIKHVRILNFYLTLDNLDRIRISIPWLNPGFPYLVCKKLSVKLEYL